MGHHGSWYMRLLALVSIASLVGASATAAQEAAPHGRPGDVNGWSVADERQLDIDGELISLSPDGRWIAGEGPFGAFCLWDVADLNPVCRSEEQYSIAPGSIAWALDSSAVAFSLDFDQLRQESDIFVFHVGSGEITNLTDDGIENRSVDYLIEETDFLAEHTGPLPIDVYPAWSLDGQELTFARFDYLSEPSAQTLMTVSVDGGDPIQLLELEPAAHLLINSPMRWLENGSLLYTRMPADVFEPKDGGLWTYEPDSEPVQILSGTADDPYPIPIATDVHEHDGTTTILGFSLLLGTFPSSDPDQSGGFALDLGTGSAVHLQEFASLDSPDASGGEAPLIFAPPRISPDGSAIVLSVRQELLGPESLVIASTESGPAPVFIDNVEGSGGLDVAFRGYSWASNDTILVPLAEGPIVLLTLERSAEATPAAPCSCTPPPRS